MSYFKKCIFIFIFIIQLSSLARAETLKLSALKQAIDLGKNFLTTKLLEEKYSLSCKASIKKSVCPVSNSGKILLSHFIVNVLSPDISTITRDKIITMIHAEENNGLWGYSPSSPLDSDDSSFALQTLTLLNQPQESNKLAAFYKPKIHAYATFLTNQDTPIAAEVNANIDNVFHILQQDSLINYELLNHLQTQQGYWRSHFYSGKYYSTYITMKLLCATQRKSSSVTRGLHFIIVSQNQNGSWGAPGNAYETALALNTLLACEIKSSESVKKGIKYLMKQQQKAGDWSAGNIIWTYLYQEQPRISWSAYDNQHVLTTALSVKALIAYYLQHAKESHEQPKL